MLKLGIVGMSPGNGHPYSWSAIFNGYDLVEIENCGFPVIPRYLEKHKFPEELIHEAKVTHIWTQTEKVSRHIAKTTFIDNVADSLNDLIGEVDAILLARDDFENHFQLAGPFIEAGLPIYIDKPLAISNFEAKKIFDLEVYPGQIFSCSAMRYAPELSNLKNEIDIKKITTVHGYVSNDWNRYAVHVIDPILNFLGDDIQYSDYSVINNGDCRVFNAKCLSGVEISIHTLGQKKCPITIKIGTEEFDREYLLTDTFGAFKASLKDFVDGILQKDVRISQENIYKVVEMISLGNLNG